MTTLITGGAGFVGSRLAARLLAANQPVVLFDNFDPYYDPTVKRTNVAALGPGVPLIEGDIRDEAAIARAFADYGITRVAHLAAMAGVRFSTTRAKLYTDVNVRGTVNLLEAAAQHNVENFILASTGSVYGDDTPVPFVESAAAAMPLAPYPASKRAAELFGHSFHHLTGLNVTVLRFFNVYGPHGRPDMMPVKALQAILGGETIQLWNGGELARDWTYIDDTVTGVGLALDKPLGFDVLNLGFGRPVKLLDFIQIYEELVGREAVTEVAPAPPTEPQILYCDNSRARRVLGYDPQTDLPEGLAHTWAWYREAHMGSGK